MESRLATKDVYYDTVPVEGIVVDSRCQRLLQEGRVKEILKDGFDCAASGTVVISRRKNGEEIVDVCLDGQHRIEAAKRSGHLEIRAQIYEGLTFEEENWLFDKLNRKKNPHPVVQFNARINYGDETAVEINKILTSYGWMIKEKKRSKVFTAVKTAESIYLGVGPFRGNNLDRNLLDLVIDTLTHTWGMDSAATDYNILSGLAIFFLRYGTQADKGKLIASLGRFTAERFRAEGVAVKDQLQINPGMAFAWAIHREYNKGLRSKKLGAFNFTSAR